VVGKKKQPIRPIQIERELSGTVTLQFVTPPWQTPHCAKSRSSTQVVEAAPEKFCSLAIVFPNKALKIVAIFRQRAIFKNNVHTAPSPTFTLTPGVNIIKRDFELRKVPKGENHAVTPQRREEGSVLLRLPQETRG
jgi:hypothetical protein